jgi:hypothetical protein
VIGDVYLDVCVCVQALIDKLRTKELGERSMPMLLGQGVSDGFADRAADVVDSFAEYERLCGSSTGPQQVTEEQGQRLVQAHELIRVQALATRALVRECSAALKPAPKAPAAAPVPAVPVPAAEEEAAAAAAATPARS